jgi:hypothetical protein
MLILRCVTSMALLACVGVNGEGFTEVLAVEVQFRAGSCRSYAEFSASGSTAS